jgi:hypothetical protein
VDSLERQSRRLSERVDAFQESRPAPPPAEEGSLFVLGIDAKGVPMRGAADAPSIKSHEHKRGPKTGRKKQAMVAAVYSVDPLIRTPEHVAELLFCEPRERPELAKRPELCHKRVRARLNEFTDADGVKHDGLAEAFRWMTTQVKQRNAAGDKVVVRLMDGDERFRSEQKRHAVTGQTVDILDLLHVTPRLWKASRLLNEDDATVRRWVEAVLKADSMAMKRVEVAVVTFAPVQTIQSFVTADTFIAPALKTTGDTPMGGAIQCAIDMLQERKSDYRSNGVGFYRPWIFLITDGASADEVILRAVLRLPSGCECSYGAMVRRVRCLPGRLGLRPRGRGGGLGPLFRRKSKRRRRSRRAPVRLGCWLSTGLGSG